MSVELANFLFEVANFLVLFALLGWVLFKPVRKALEEERARFDEERAQVESEREVSKRLAEEARALRAGAVAGGQEERAQIVKAAQVEAARVVEEARDTVRRAQARAERTREDARREGVEALVETVAEVVATSVRELMVKIHAPALDLALVRAACEELKALPRAPAGSATVEVAAALAPEAKRLLVDALGQPLQERVVAELGAGVRVTTASGQVDASALAIARRAAREVTGGDIEEVPTHEETSGAA